MFDPYDQVRMRTQRLLASASQIRQERALQASAQEREGMIAATAPPSPAAPSPVRASRSDAVSPSSPDRACSGSPATSGPSRSRAA